MLCSVVVLFCLDTLKRTEESQEASSPYFSPYFSPCNSALREGGEAVANAAAGSLRVRLSDSNRVISWIDYLVTDSLITPSASG